MKTQWFTFLVTSLLLFAFSACDDDPSTKLEICNNAMDDDGDGLIDCMDPDCMEGYLPCQNQNNNNTNNAKSCIEDSDCDDNNPCTIDLCNDNDQCQNQDDTQVCDDGDPCTDESCDPETGCATTGNSCVDVRADHNRDGIVDMEDPEDDEGEETWDPTKGALFLANLDDDEASCPTEGLTGDLIECNDAADEVVNGPEDLYDLAPIHIRAWPDAPDDASISLRLSQYGEPHVRLFVFREGAFEHLPPPWNISLDELRSGVDLAIEGTDLVRDATDWDGTVDISITVTGGTGIHGAIPTVQDTVRMRVAPLRFPSDINAVSRFHLTDYSSSLVSKIEDLRTTSGVADSALVFPYTDRFYTSQLYLTAYTALPGVSSPHIMKVMLRTSLQDHRDAPNVVFTHLKGQDVAATTGFEDASGAPTNIIITPPYSVDGQHYPNGRAIIGRVDENDIPYPTFSKLLEANGLGPVAYGTISDLIVMYIADYISFLPADTPRGWVMLIADPAYAKELLIDAANAGFGDTPMFVGKTMPFGIDTSVETTVTSCLLSMQNPDAVEIEESLDQLRAELKEALGLYDYEIISVPAIYTQYGLTDYMALLPNMVGGMLLPGSLYAIHEPFGPMVNGADIFKVSMVNQLEPFGITPVFVDLWEEVHQFWGTSLKGMVNSERTIPQEQTWSY